MSRKFDRRRRPEDHPKTIEARKAGRVVTYTRRDALIRVLETAIELWFRGQEDLSAHLLAMAAHECLCSLGYVSFLKKAVGWTHFGLAYEWLKHAKKDPDDVLDFSPLTNFMPRFTCLLTIRRFAKARRKDCRRDLFWVKLNGSV
jgi:hypothetical protein